MKTSNRPPLLTNKMNPSGLNSVHNLKEGVTKRLLEKYKPNRGVSSINVKHNNLDQKNQINLP